VAIRTVGSVVQAYNSETKQFEDVPDSVRDSSGAKVNWSLSNDEFFLLY